MKQFIKRVGFTSCLLLLLFNVFAQLEKDVYGNARLINQPDKGYRGIWYNIGVAAQNGPVANDYININRAKYKYKYSGGFGTYPANHYPFSVYAKEVNKTFFCY